jgi:hypothetical protein
MIESKISQDTKMMVCKDCMNGIIIIENSKGDVLNLEYVARFMDNHPEIDITTYQKFAVGRKDGCLKL